MPIITQAQLEALQAKVREVIIDSTDDALALIKEALPAGRAKHNQVLLLISRATDVANHDIGNTLPPHLLDVLRNELRHDVLTFTDHLSLPDFGPEAPARPELKPGHLLYKVPPKMAIRETYECLIRIAHQLNDVLEGIELDESVSLEELPVAEVMEVEIIDPSPDEEPAFDILLLSDGEQLVDEFSATDWVFNIRPLRAGEHRLVLKISVLITVGGKERTKNIVLQRPISVVAQVEESAPTVMVRVAEDKAVVEEHFEIDTTELGSPPPPVFYPPVASDAPPPAAPQKPSRSTPNGGGSGGVRPPLIEPAAEAQIGNSTQKRSRRMRYFSLAASVLLVVSFAWWFLPAAFNKDSGVDHTSPPSVIVPSVGVDIDTIDKVDGLDSLGRDSLR